MFFLILMTSFLISTTTKLKKKFTSLFNSLNMKSSCGSMDMSLRELIVIYCNEEELADIHGYIKSQKDISRENATIKRKK